MNSYLCLIVVIAKMHAFDMGVILKVRRSRTRMFMELPDHRRLAPLRGA